MSFLTQRTQKSKIPTANKIGLIRPKSERPSRRDAPRYSGSRVTHTLSESRSTAAAGHERSTSFRATDGSPHPITHHNKRTPKYPRLSQSKNRMSKERHKIHPLSIATPRYRHGVAWNSDETIILVYLVDIGICRSSRRTKNETPPPPKLYDNVNDDSNLPTLQLSTIFYFPVTRARESADNSLLRPSH